MKTPPNILLILCHDLGQRLGCYGVQNLKTPVLDALATKGVLCENYFATAPLCSPSRGSIMTGLYPHTNGLMGLVNRGWDMPDTHPTLAQLLRGNGYATELFGGRCCSESEARIPTLKHQSLLFGFQHEKKQSHRMGYEEHYHAKGPHTCNTVSTEFIEWLRARDKSSPPFFACLGFFEVHRQFKNPRYTPDDPAIVELLP
jgi:arylsulfatase A-like enzyme